MMSRMLLLLATVGSSGALGPKGLKDWCAGPPARQSHTPQPPVNGSEFRGAFRDLALWLEPEGTVLEGAKRGCQVFKQHAKGNDGLWVIEFDHTLDMYREEKAARRAGIPVLMKKGLTLLLGGGEKVPDALGYDACGMDEDKRVISVPAENVRGPQPMSRWSKAAYMRAARNKRVDIASIVDEVSDTSLTSLISHMEQYGSRNSYSGTDDLVAAANWAEEQFKSYGFTVTRDEFRSDMVPQVIAELPGVKDASKVVVAGAHYDSRGTQRNSPTQRAPGADDNGSGSAALVELARLIHKNKVTFAHTLKLMLFTGEEQGLLGSRAISRDMASKGEQVIAMFNADMLGYRQPGQDITLAFMDRYVDMDLTEITFELVHTYVPGLKTDFTQGCCSDQQSFYEAGFPSVGFFETPTSRVVYPQYHRSDDLLENLDVEQIKLEAQAVCASTLLFADPQ